jgi:hypothetical protein
LALQYLTPILVIKPVAKNPETRFLLPMQLTLLPTPMDKKLTEHDRAIGAIFSAIRELMHPKAPVPKHRPIGFTADLEEKS